MNHKLKNNLINVAKKHINNDLSHDFNHAMRVMNLAVKIAVAEGGNLDIIIPAALFHDVIVYKGSHKYHIEHRKSAEFAKNTLFKIREYPKEKIKLVEYSILVCSFSKNIKPKTLEAKILQDADLLESTVLIILYFG